MTELRKRIRIEQTQDELDRLKSDIKTWIEARRKIDSLQQYRTQLNVLDHVFGDALGALFAQFDPLAQLSFEDLYARCRSLDRGLLWERRVWDYFRVKFEQRSDPALKNVLAAADELVWSCYAEPFRRAGSGAAPLGPVPLPYIEPEYAAHAVPRGEAAQDLKPDMAALYLKEFLGKVPLPLIALPPRCAEYPWCLIYVAHEVGHHVQYELLANRMLIKRFGDLLRDSAHTSAEPGRADASAKRWEGWAAEIFADAFSLASVGAGALWAMAELERADTLGMLRPKEQYPAPLVRLALMAAIADRLGAEGKATLSAQGVDAGTLLAAGGALDPGLRELAAADLKCVEPIADAIVHTSFGGVGTLAELCGCAEPDYENRARTRLWAATLLGREEESPLETLRGPRTILRGALSAWLEIAALEDDQRREVARLRWRECTLSMLARSHDQVVRGAAPAPAVNVEGLGAQLTQLALTYGAPE